MRKWNLVVLSILLVLSSILVGQIIYRHNTTTVLKVGVYAGSTWDVYSDQPYQWIDQAVSQFQKDHPKIRIEYESGIRKEDYMDWLSEKIVNGEMPDVFIVPPEDFDYLADDAAFCPLDHLLTDQEKAEFYPAALNAGKYKGVQYAMPLESNPYVMCVNTDILKKEGIAVPDNDWTVDQFEKICEEVTKDTNNDGIIDQHGTADYSWKYMLESMGLQAFDEDGMNCLLNETKQKEALLKVQSLHNLNQGYRVTSKDFDAGKAAFLPMTFAEYRTYRSYPYHISKFSGFSWICLQMPGTKENKKTTISPSLVMAVSSQCAQKKQAEEFVRYCALNDDLQKVMFTSSSGAPVRKNITNSQEIAETLMNGNDNTESITPETLDNILENAGEEPEFDKYGQAMEHADYLLTNSINNDTLNNDLSEITRELNTMLKE